MIPRESVPVHSVAAAGEPDTACTAARQGRSGVRARCPAPRPGGRPGGGARIRARPGRGFTLIEVLVVVVILGILAAVVAPRFFDKPGEARVARAKVDIQALGTALNLYRLDNFSYPSTEQGLTALVQKPGGSPEARNWKQGGYIERLPKDPWGRDYLYLSPGQRGEFDVYSLGLDGRPGGDGENADVGNWGE